ncbi:iron-containing alcohol dehydrogenase [uncultured Clostridium sp.]|uniref:iron-containing alcohol dehydrogenase n=1 Tax=uncultured Clostridium sp. TaxID=59620 RepID=UPI0025EEA8D4|nr:iron-containing alcohol dehydrogenase [uncultured Clostridium sp.]
MRILKVEPAVYKYNNCRDFCEEFRIGKDDFIITNQSIYGEFLNDNTKESAVILAENYSTGSSSYKIVESIYESIKRISYERVIAIGDALILQIGKIFALKNICPVKDLFDQKMEILKEKELVLVPAVLGYTTEMANICTLNFSSENSLKELLEDELYADSTVLIPELLNLLSFKSFIAGSSDIFIQAVSLYVSPALTDYMRLFVEKSMSIILNGYKKLAAEGKEYYINLFEEFILASNYINTALSNINQNLINKADVILNYNILQDGDGCKYIFDFFKNFLISETDVSSLRLSNLISGILQCSREDVYDNLTDIYKSILSQMSIV